MEIVKIKILTVFGLLFGFGLIFLGFGELGQKTASDDFGYRVVKSWQLPDALREVSGIAWLDDGRIAAVQDEEGSIFIFDPKTGKIAREIDFAGAGDYEGIAVKGDDAYVLRSDGAIFEIVDFRDDKRKISVHTTPFSRKNDMESLEWDPGNGRLLIAPKYNDPNSARFKGIYSFSSVSKKVEEAPVFQIDMGDEILNRYRKKDIGKTFRPSDLAIHPKTKDIYILDGAKPKLLILTADGEAKQVYAFDENDFPQPEAITFCPDGTLYIASEAKKENPAMLYLFKMGDR
ncbi:SdiA-regulated domain-containing protein [Pseudozobellia thermophila]|uniref:Uncharacterized protein YjiK n=1 Tax=Pseudozobellia thermophila TaxID=192903 RepID=A0A1M6CI98_9FLAO|nr:SdiA-regulated domain-containing protein [Pseudozobellia thermophila]SHI60581.1 Uncharacterized protein YjiK [Pseudozobellia thermophila]